MIALTLHSFSLYKNGSIITCNSPYVDFHVLLARSAFVLEQVFLSKNEEILQMKPDESHNSNCVYFVKMFTPGWGWSSVVEHLPSIHEALGLIPSTVHIQKF
jgi:hypothetical protein